MDQSLRLAWTFLVAECSCNCPCMTANQCARNMYISVPHLQYENCLNLSRKYPHRWAHVSDTSKVIQNGNAHYFTECNYERFEPHATVVIILRLKNCQ